MSRRKFMTGAAAVGAAAFAAGGGPASANPIPQEPHKSPGEVPKRPMGKTGLQCSIIGIGGYHLGSVDEEKDAMNLVAKAMDLGVNFFDNAWEYHDGMSEERLGRALEGKRDRAIVMTKVCTHGRDKNLAMRMLDESLRRLRTDHLDVWQIHEVIYENDPDLIFGPNGAIEALQLAKQQGKVRFIGFTGHKNPKIHLKMLSHNFPFDTIQMPLNCFDANFRSFEKQVLPEANQRGMAVFGMKSLGGSGEMVRTGAITPAEGLRYAMSLPVATTISGIDSVGVLEQNLEIAGGFTPMSASEMQKLRERVRPDAADGHLELFKMSTMYDGKIGREQHHMPSTQELPL